MLQQLSGYDWKETFKYCNGGYIGTICGDEDVSIKSFTREDVAEIIAISDGQNDGDSWVAIFKLLDGRYAFVSARCDYTGWGCQESGRAIVSNNLNALKLLGVPISEHARLGISLIEVLT
jgi:hypothetical protein